MGCEVGVCGVGRGAVSAAVQRLVKETTKSQPGRDTKKQQQRERGDNTPHARNNNRMSPCSISFARAESRAHAGCIGGW